MFAVQIVIKKDQLDILKSICDVHKNTKVVATRETDIDCYTCTVTYKQPESLFYLGTIFGIETTEKLLKQ